jgi:alpha-ketoglutarate-dependent taurine dioxygenase
MNAPSPGFAVAQLTPAVGGLVTGLDLERPLSDAVVAKLRAALAEPSLSSLRQCVRACSFSETA